MKEEFIDKVKSRGYWRVNFRPLGPPKSLSMQECRQLVDKNSVRLRGWYFPFYHDGRAEHYSIDNHNDYLGGWIDAGEQKEFWRMYRSGQFLHYAGVDEDWMDGKQERQLSTHIVEPGKYLNFVGSLTFYITEIVEFMSRLHHSGLYEEGVVLSIELHNTKDRQLTSFELMRHLTFPKVTAEKTIKFRREYTAEELQKPAEELAIEPILYFFELFNFGDVSIDQVIKRDQDTLYGRSPAGI